MGGLGFFAGGECGGGHRLWRVYRGADAGGIVLRQQALQRVMHKSRVAEMSVAVAVGMAHRLDQEVHRGCRAEAERL